MSDSGNDPEFLSFVELFNNGDFEESHEALLPAWQENMKYDFYKAMIQLAGALLHWNSGNAFWAADLFASSHNLLAKYAPEHQGLDVERLLEEIRECHAVAKDASEQRPAGELKAPQLSLRE